MKSWLMWVLFLVLLLMWAGALIARFGGALVHVLLVLAIVDLMLGLVIPRRAS